MTDSEVSTIHPNLGLLSYSSCCTLHTCPRKFQLRKLYNPQEQQRERDIHTDFGSLVGYGVQVFLVTGDLNLTYLKMLTTWTEDLDSDEAYKDKKTFFHALAAIDKFVFFRQSVLKDWNVVWLSPVGDQAIPTTELGFQVNFWDNFRYRGFLDVLLQNKFTGAYKVLETKTSKYIKINEAQFVNSAQGLGYSLVVDAIASLEGKQQADSFEVMYLIFTTPDGGEWNELSVPHSHSDRALWLRGIVADIRKIAEYSETEYFPQYGESCYSYFRQCDYFGICGMSDTSLMLDRAQEIKEDESKYAFVFEFMDLLKAQEEKHKLVG